MICFSRPKSRVRVDDLIEAYPPNETEEVVVMVVAADLSPIARDVDREGRHPDSYANEAVPKPQHQGAQRA